MLVFDASTLSIGRALAVRVRLAHVLPRDIAALHSLQYTSERPQKDAGLQQGASSLTHGVTSHFPFVMSAEAL